MAGSASNYLEQKILDMLGGVAITIPTNWYVGLATATITDTDTGSTVTEVSGGGYAREAVVPNTTNFPSAQPCINGTDIDFGTTTGSWGTVTDWFIADAATLGNIWWYGDLTASRVIGSGVPVKFPAGDLSINVT